MSGKRVAVEYLCGRAVCTWTQCGSECQATPAATGVLSQFQRWMSAFVPEGAVSDDYFEFQTYDSIQGLCSYVRGMLSSQAILKGVGIGSAAATSSSAIFQFFLRDLSGMLGGVLFAALNGAGLDSHAKQWRLFADCFNNVGYLLELLSPVFPSTFLLLACLGSIARAITGVAAGATRAALTQHFAQNGNAADVSAKEGSQETAVTLVGMLLGMATVHLCSGSEWLVWAIFLLLTALHIYANIKAMRSLRLRSLNRPRLDLILTQYKLHKRVPSVAKVAASESLLAPPLARLAAGLWRNRYVDLVLGARFSALENSTRARLLSLGEATPYHCWFDQRQRMVQVLLSPGADNLTVLDAYIEAWCLAHHAQHKIAGRAPDRIALNESKRKELLSAIKNTGWDLKRITLGDTGWRVAWGDRLHEE